MLPVDEVIPEIIAAVSEDRAVVLKAPPGAGKTTAVPPAIMKTGCHGGGKILLIQPRRLAARSAAKRLASVMDTQLGQRVGYQVRFDRCATNQTELIAMTTGILLRQLQGDPLLEDVSCVILDEFHERSVELDLSLGMLQRIRSTFRPELKLLVMSATLDPIPITDFLNQDEASNAIAIESQGRSFPVDVSYQRNATPRLGDRRSAWENDITTELSKMMQKTDGDILVFLPGVGEIRRCEQALADRLNEPSIQLHQLYGDLPPDRQDAVLRPSDSRKIILATNVAETSITIDGVTGVIDSGQARVLSFDKRLGLSKLKMEPISQASAEQRSGRAGRTAPGIAVRLWESASHRSRRPTDLPEIVRCDFSGPLLKLAQWGERDVFGFPWLTPPLEEAVQHARTTLVRLGAIDEESNVTPIGQKMSDLSLPPRLARFMIEAEHLGVTDQASVAASLLTERDPFRGSSESFLDRVERLLQFEKKQSHLENISAAKNCLRVAKQIRRSFESPSLKTKKKNRQPSNGPDHRRLDNESLCRSLLVSYSDRVAKRRPEESHRALMVGGKGLKFTGNLVAPEHELFLAIDVDSSAGEASVRQAVPIDEKWLDELGVEEEIHYEFDDQRSAVTARKRRRWEDLVLSKATAKCEPGPDVAAMLHEGIKKSGKRILPDPETNSGKETARFIERLNFLAAQLDTLSLKLIDDDAIDQLLQTFCQTRTKYSEIQSAPWLDHLRAMYDYPVLCQIDAEAPARMKVPSGKWADVHYDTGKPVMAVRIQDLFGWPSTPRIAGGRVPVQLHLLGPNYRPQQITEDLQNFWAVTYHEVRKELKRRYPKHYWPEDPSTAKATPNGLKPR